MGLGGESEADLGVDRVVYAGEGMFVLVLLLVAKEDEEEG